MLPSLRSRLLSLRTTAALTRAASRTTASKRPISTRNNHLAPANARQPSITTSAMLRAAAPVTGQRALATLSDSSPSLGAPSPVGDVKTNPEFSTNPILNWAAFPDFAAIKAEHVVPAMEALVNHVESVFAERSRHFSPTWEGTMGLSKSILPPYQSPLDLFVGGSKLNDIT
ncbi:hypothetical protein BGZ68_009721 [Mortierella alpina]|nr:hypothetical protein BGZ68_009721 [Mortierella alpina]